MDPWAVHVKNLTQPPLWLRNSTPEKPILWKSGKPAMLKFNVFKRTISFSRYHPLVVKATGKKNQNDSSSFGSDDRSNPEGDNSRRNNFPGSKKSNDSSSQKAFSVKTDWREFRANLYNQEKEEEAESDGQNQGVTPQEAKPRTLNWAHPIPMPETGCVLVATEKLDGVRTFERTVILLLRSGTRHPQEGPFGVVINRPHHEKIKSMRLPNNELATTYSDCLLHFGGPLDTTMFLLKTGDNQKLPGLEEVIPGLSFGTLNSLEEATGLVKKGLLKPQDFKFFVGYAGWQLDQLKMEIESDYWCVAACSSNLIYGSSSESLWEDILKLMGGDYSEMSQKPKEEM